MTQIKWKDTEACSGVLVDKVNVSQQMCPHGKAASSTTGCANRAVPAAEANVVTPFQPALVTHICSPVTHICSPVSLLGSPEQEGCGCVGGCPAKGQEGVQGTVGTSLGDAEGDGVV